MRRIQVWATFNACVDVEDIYQIAKHFNLAAEEARKFGCRVEFSDMDIGDLSVEVSGSSDSVRRAAEAYEERGFTVGQLEEA